MSIKQVESLRHLIARPVSTERIKTEPIIIRIAPIITHVHNETCTHSRQITQYRNSFFQYNKGLLLKERIRSLWERILSFKRSPKFERGTINNQYLFHKSPFDMCNFCSGLATPLIMDTEFYVLLNCLHCINIWFLAAHSTITTTLSLNDF